MTVGWRFRVAYRGDRFLGWQRQPQGLTVQEALETAFATLWRTPVIVRGSGRTDTGVSARGQVAAVEGPADLDVRRCLRSLQGLLPSGIAVRDLERAPQGFDPRHGARFREYCYRLHMGNHPVGEGPAWCPPRRWNPEGLAATLTWFEGTHDFSRFCIPRDDGRSTVCTLWMAHADPMVDGVRVWIRGDRFLHRMVRAIVGFCLDASAGRADRTSFEAYLAGGGQTTRTFAPPDGLTLERVGYPDWTEPARRGQPDAHLSDADILRMCRIPHRPERSAFW